jgi:hypothetical protein
MSEVCCQLVGDLALDFSEGCLISINTTCNTEAIIACGEENPLAGPTTGTLSITSFTGNELWEGCPSKVGLSVNYLRRYDCESNILYFIPNGQGQSFIYGDITSNIAEIKYKLFTCVALSASSSSGPAAIYTNTPQTNGYGLIYNGGPINIETTPEMLPMQLGVLPGSDLYLQSFSFDAQPGQFPTVTYSFAYTLEGEE